MTRDLDAGTLVTFQAGYHKDEAAVVSQPITAQTAGDVLILEDGHVLGVEVSL